MPAAAVKTTEVTAPNELEAARTEFNALKAHRKELVRTLDQVRLARQLASQPEPLHARAANAIAAAGPELTLARRSPRRTDVRIEDLENELAEMRPHFDAAKERFETACGVEAGEISRELLPRHQAAVSRISSALQELSASLAEEIEVRDEFLKRAPAPGMSCPWPNFSSLLLPTCWMPHWDSRASVWHREAIARGYLQETTAKAPAK